MASSARPTTPTSSALAPQHVDALVTALEGRFYIDADSIRDAIHRRASFNIIHLATMREEIEVMILHEIGHFFGLDEEDMTRLGLE